MGTFSRIAEALRGARKLEIFLGVAVICAVCLLASGNIGENGSGMTALETRMADIFSEIEGAGEVRVLINESEDGGVEGVLVVAEGADRLDVRLRLMSAVMATLGTDASRIEIIGMEGAR